MTTHAALLEDRGALRVSGPEARSFLQGLLTLDMNKASPRQAQAGALLTPQGKILFDVILLEHEEHFWIETAASECEALAKRLQFYKLRAKVNIESLRDWHILAFWPGAPLDIGFQDPRWTPLGRRAFAKKDMVELLVKKSQARLSSPEAYHAHRIAEAIPEAEKDYALGDTFPQEADFDLLHGIDFTKGCYVGQEVVSRMEHRGAARKRILPFRIEGTVPERGASIVAGETNLGTFGSSAKDRALALIRLDRLEEAVKTGVPIKAQDARLFPLQPPWANFTIAGAAA